MSSSDHFKKVPIESAKEIPQRPADQVKERIFRELGRKVSHVEFTPGHAAGEGEYRIVVAPHISRSILESVGFTQEEASKLERKVHTPGIVEWIVPSSLMAKKFPGYSEMQPEKLSEQIRETIGVPTAEITREDTTVTIGGVPDNVSREMLVGVEDRKKVEAYRVSTGLNSIIVPEAVMHQKLGIGSDRPR